MERNYKSYDEEFKKNIVKLIENGKPIADIVREYSLNRSLIYSWKKKYETIKVTEGVTTCNEEIIKIQNENRQLKEENEILKKAVAIFTKQQ